MPCMESTPEGNQTDGPSSKPSTSCFGHLVQIINNSHIAPIYSRRREMCKTTYSLKYNNGYHWIYSILVVRIRYIHCIQYILPFTIVNITAYCSLHNV